ncbi:Nucleoside-diphosphate-sugar epimerase [Fibrobacter sp. UWCM]|uniref:NAD-dependent epimerase/dehydratase family protein n=1 Tax=Fibrobacter sp. UWCM TaxID=1896208 RepID=UPI00090F7AE4|nr:NAD-dependent epimerase/dehydratase family protein [Fibrobacter sp. UWCM]SHH83446.1 Nucleoside-diphosphate-sugar epimerase [Fibrobacter sp. UWCM]
MKLLIIGGTGILSTAVVNEAIGRGFDVTMVNRGKNKIFVNPDAELIACDIRKDMARLPEILQGRKFDAVIDFLIWTKEQLKLSLEVLGKLTSQYVFISSAQVYNTSISQEKNEQSEKPQKLWKYSINKYEAEEFLKEYCSAHDVNYTIIRPGVNYGDTRIPYGMFPVIGFHWTFVERIRAGKPIVTWNNGQNRLNLTRVEDFAVGVVGLLGKKSALNEDFNVVGDNVYSWMDVLTTMSDILGLELKTVDVPVDFYALYLEGDQKESLVGGRACDLVCSNEKLKRIVPDFKTMYDLKDGLKKTLDFYQRNNYYKGFDYHYDALQDLIIKDFSSLKYHRKISGLKFVDYDKKGLKNKLRNYLCYQKNFHSNSWLIKVLSSLKK